MNYPADAQAYHHSLKVESEITRFWLLLSQPSIVFIFNPCIGCGFEPHNRPAHTSTVYRLPVSALGIHLFALPSACLWTHLIRLLSTFSVEISPFTTWTSFRCSLCGHWSTYSNIENYSRLSIGNNYLIRNSVSSSIVKYLRYDLSDVVFIIIDLL